MPEDKKVPGSQMRITPLERELLRNTFKGNEELIRLFRKIFLPEPEPYAPIGQLTDLWMSIPLNDQTDEQIANNVRARNQTIAHIESCLMTIKILAESPEDETVEELRKKQLKNSSK